MRRDQTVEVSPAVPPGSASEAPDWHNFERQILCPLCDYDLRGLSELRCPECGYRFEWAKLLDPAAQRHPYLFEHHPRRNIWSFGKTLIGGFRPRRFWSTLTPAQPSRPRRLILYWMLTTALLVAT